MSPRDQHNARARATRDDVARLAGVSSAVVSYVVNETKHVSPATEARVREAIEMLGYQPNPAARALRLGSTEAIGLVLPSLANPLFAGLAEEVEREATRHSLDVLIATTDITGDDGLSHIRHFARRRVDGVLLCTPMSDAALAPLRQAGVPIVFLNASMVHGIDAIGVDLEAGARVAVGHLADHGHRRIGLVIGTYRDGTRDAREDGWRAALDERGLEAGPVLRGDFGMAAGYRAGHEFADMTDRPPAVFISADQQAIGFLRALAERGVRVPEDIAVASFDGSPLGQYTWPSLTSVSQPIQEMARAAVNAIVHHDEHTAYTGFAPTLVARESCGCEPSVS